LATNFRNGINAVVQEENTNFLGIGNLLGRNWNNVVKKWKNVSKLIGKATFE
jgi:hypothetical protein